jgi:hypothetical protein
MYPRSRGDSHDKGRDFYWKDFVIRKEDPAQIFFNQTLRPKFTSYGACKHATKKWTGVEEDEDRQRRRWRRLKIRIDGII